MHPETQIEVVFIGGPLDGERRRIILEPRAREYHCPVLPTFKDWLGKPFPRVTRPTYSITRYFLELFRVNAVTYYLYRHESLTIEQASDKLFKGYRPLTDEKEK